MTAPTPPGPGGVRRAQEYLGLGPDQGPEPRLAGDSAGYGDAGRASGPMSPSAPLVYPTMLASGPTHFITRTI